MPYYYKTEELVEAQSDGSLAGTAAAIAALETVIEEISKDRSGTGIKLLKVFAKSNTAGGIVAEAIEFVIDENDNVSVGAIALGAFTTAVVVGHIVSQFGVKGLLGLVVANTGGAFAYSYFEDVALNTLETIIDDWIFDVEPIDVRFTDSNGDHTQGAIWENGLSANEMTQGINHLVQSSEDDLSGGSIAFFNVDNEQKSGTSPWHVYNGDVFKEIADALDGGFNTFIGTGANGETNGTHYSPNANGLEHVFYNQEEGVNVYLPMPYDGNTPVTTVNNVFGYENGTKVLRFGNDEPQYTVSQTGFIPNLVINDTGAPLSITGTPFRDIVLSGETADTLTGGAFDDILVGGAGADSLDGDQDNDLLSGGGFHVADDGVGYGLEDNAADTILGGAGDDTLYGGFGDSLDGGAGTDTVYALNTNYYNNDAEGDVIYSHASGGYWWDVHGGSGNDTIYAYAEIPQTLHQYWDGVGPAQTNILGGAGNDTIFAHNQTVNGGAGDDLIILTGGHNVIYHSGGNDTYVINEGEMVTDQFGPIYEGPYATFIGGDFGDATFFIGDQQITGGEYFAYENPNHDLRLEYNIGFGDKQWIGMLGTTGSGSWAAETADYVPFVNLTIADMDNVGYAAHYYPIIAIEQVLTDYMDEALFWTYFDPTVDDSPYEKNNDLGMRFTTGDHNHVSMDWEIPTFGPPKFSQTPNDYPGTDEMDVAANLLANMTSDDTSTGGSGNGVQNGTNGDDTLAGDSSSNEINGLPGNDTIDGNEGNDTITGGDGQDTLRGDADDDSLSGDAGNDTIDGGSGNDTLSGGSGNDSMYGGSGADLLIDGLGNDTLIGAGDTDTYQIALEAGATDRIRGFSSSEVIDLSASFPSGTNVAPVQVGSNTQIDLGNGQLLIVENFTASSLTNSNFVGATIGSGGGNSDPVAVDDAFSGDEDSTISGNVLTNDTDADTGDTLSASLDTGPSNGSVNLNSDGSFTYTPNAGFDGTDSFTYIVSDGNGGSDTGLVDLTVNDTTSGGGSGGAFDFTGVTIESYAGQDAGTASTIDGGAGIELNGNAWKKVALDNTYTLTADSKLKFDFQSTEEGEIQGIGLENGTDNSFTNGQPTFQFWGSQSHSSITPLATDYSGSGWQTFIIDLGGSAGFTADYFAFISDDDGPKSANSQFRNVELYEDTGSGGGNSDPVAVDDAFSGDEDSTISGNVLTNDTDADTGDTLSASVDTGPSNGSVNLNSDGSFTYTPNAGFDGTDSFTYTVSDGNGGADTGLVDLTVNDTTSGGGSGGAFDFTGATIEGYAGQDAGTASTIEGGAGIELNGNAWKKVELDNTYTLTVDSKLKFDFQSTEEGEIQGIGLENGTDNSFTNGQPTFQFWGSQSHSSITPLATDYSGSGWQTFIIDLGGSAGFTADYFAFISDDDGPKSANSQFRNVELYEDTGSGGSAGENWTGTSGADSRTGTADDDTLNGAGGNDTIDGAAGNDGIEGKDGDDQLFGSAGDDTLWGDGGNDSADGGADNDTVIGGDGNDTLFGGEGNDSILGDADADTIFGGNGDDTIFGGTGNDSLQGDGGFDSLHGGLGDDTLFGSSENDTLFGNEGIDELIGEGGNDYLEGGADGDFLQGGIGNDTLVGGAGTDYFFFDEDAGATDVITDFDPNGETIDLTAFGVGFTIVSQTQNGADVDLDLGNGQGITLEGVLSADVTSADFAYAT